MTTPSDKSAPINDQRIYQALHLMQQKDYDGAEHQILQGLKEAQKAGNAELQGAFYSVMGILYKLRGDYKKSYKYYQQAEKLVPDDDALKIISAILLVEQFNQFDTAARKLKKIIGASTDPVTVHHARAVLGVALLREGQKKQVGPLYQELLALDFGVLKFVSNINFKLAEECAKRGEFLDETREFLKKAHQLAVQNQDSGYLRMIEMLLKAL